MRWVAKIGHIEGVGSEESGATIYNVDDGTFDLYEIPQYGGRQMYVGNYSSIEECKQIAESWT